MLLAAADNGGAHEQPRQRRFPPLVGSLDGLPSVVSVSISALVIVRIDVVAAADGLVVGGAVVVGSALRGRRYANVDHLGRGGVFSALLSLLLQRSNLPAGRVVFHDQMSIVYCRAAFDETPKMIMIDLGAAQLGAMPS